MKIFIAGTKKSETPIKLAKHLKNTTAGYELVVDDKTFVINYGRKNIIANLNKKLSANKIEQLEVLRENNIPVPKIWTINNDMNHRYFKKITFPLMARKKKHSRGSDIIFLKTRFSMKKRIERIKNRDFIVKYIPKEKEYRVHVLGDVAIEVCEKKHSKKAIENNINIHPHVWSKERGWTLETIESEGLTEIKELAVKAIKALKYDFGAVDLMLGKDNKYYVLEINSAPRLVKHRRIKYAKYFREKEKEYRNKEK